MNKNTSKILISLFQLLLIGNLILLGIITPVYSEQTNYSVEGRIEVTMDGVNQWERSQWEFYKTTCALDETVYIDLSYYGELDLDLWIFVDENSTTSEQTNFAVDITNCDFDYKPTRYSALKTTETNSTGPEFVYYENTDFSIEREVYILVFADSGVGNSSYILNSTNPIFKVTDIQSCMTEYIAWAGFSAGLFGIYFISIKLAIKRGKTEEEKKLDKKEKIKKTTKKRNKKMKKKGESKMSARKGGGKR